MCVCVIWGVCVAVFSETPAWAYDRTVWLRFTMLLRKCECAHIAITHIRAFCLRLRSLWSMPLESSCCLYSTALCSHLLRGGGPRLGAQPVEASSYIHSPAVQICMGFESLAPLDILNTSPVLEKTGKVGCATIQLDQYYSITVVNIFCHSIALAHVFLRVNITTL